MPWKTPLCQWEECADGDCDVEGSWDNSQFWNNQYCQKCLEQSLFWDVFLRRWTPLVPCGGTFQDRKINWFGQMVDRSRGNGIICAVIISGESTCWNGMRCSASHPTGSERSAKGNSLPWGRLMVSVKAKRSKKWSTIILIWTNYLPGRSVFFLVLTKRKKCISDFGRKMVQVKCAGRPREQEIQSIFLLRNGLRIQRMMLVSELIIMTLIGKTGERSVLGN